MDRLGGPDIMPRVLCNGNGVLPHLQMVITVMEFAKDSVTEFPIVELPFSAPFAILDV